MRRVHCAYAWWLGLIVVVVGLVISQTQTASAQVRPSLSSLQQQVDTLNQQLAALKQQTTQGDSALQQQINDLQQQINALTARLAVLEQGETETLAVFDAHGKKVGTVLRNQFGSPLANVLVLMQMAGHPFMANVTPSGILGPQNALYFTSPDCTGTPFIPANTATGWPLIPIVAMRGVPGTAPNIVYISEPGAPSQAITAYSSHQGGSCFSQGSNGSFIAQAVQALSLGAWETAFPPPFSGRW